MNFVQAVLLLSVKSLTFHPILSFQLSLPSRNIKNNNLISQFNSSPSSSIALYGKLWDKLEVEPDPFDEEPVWYLMNCVVGTELDLLAQAKHVTKDLSEEYIEKLVVPQERHLRSHGKTQNVVELKVSYPGYVFCKMRLCPETYEPLQQLPLCRSWMAGTVNQKGYKKLPPAPIALSDEEVAKFKGLEEQTDAMYEKFGEDYTGRGDDGIDLIGQYEGYRVENMVKVLEGNFKGEDGVVRRLKDGQVMVRLYTYGNVHDQWFKPSEIRPMTDAEAMKGLTGPSAPVNQDQFDVSIGKRPQSRDKGGRGLRSSLGGGDTRMRRQDRINRGERGNRDLYGRTEEEMKEEEDNWRHYREEQRASQQQNRGDVWGIKERSSWDSGDDAAQYSDGAWKSGREMRREKKKNNAVRGGVESQNLNDAIEGGGEWDFFSDDPSNNENTINAAKGEDDFFTSLMSELSGTLDETPDETTTRNSKKLTTPSKTSDEDDFFNSLMSELSDTLDTAKGSREMKNPKTKEETSVRKESTTSNEDDFFNDLMSQLSDTQMEQNDGIQAGKNKPNKNSDDDFFASLEADLNESLNEFSDNSSPSNDEENDFLDVPTSAANGDFFTGLESQIGEVLSGEVIGSSHTIAGGGNQQSARKSDLNSLTVADLKVMLKERGLKVSGKKSDLIDRLIENQ